jgi:hypothetical protein
VCFLGCLVLALASQEATSDPVDSGILTINPSVTPITPQKLRQVNKNLTIGEIFRILGPARRSPCAVISCWEWLCTDGRRLEVSGDANPAAKPDKLTILPKVPTGSCPGLGDTRAEPVSFCDLVNSPDTHDGQLVLTEAVYQKGFHSGVLADRRCEPAVWPSCDTNCDGPEYKMLWKIIKQGAVARVDVIGVFRAEPIIGPDTQRFRLEIKCLLAARTLPLPAPD